ncbi:hypothetical protein ACN2XU_01530 [Primorskyibacter sp. 2E107]|uniref:hypothetical protein n=1 Tax=Primorskyibacter sp. 2E107 TaxID=3403458 RepID=UPI003AF76C54
MKHMIGMISAILACPAVTVAGGHQAPEDMLQPYLLPDLNPDAVELISPPVTLPFGGLLREDPYAPLMKAYPDLDLNGAKLSPGMWMHPSVRDVQPNATTNVRVVCYIVDGERVCYVVSSQESIEDGTPLLEEMGRHPYQR